MKSELHYHEVKMEEVQGAIMEDNTEDNNLAFFSYEQDSHLSQPIPYGSFPQILPVGSSTVENRKERKRWKPTEDIVLISAWLNTSKDCVVSNEQRSGAYWTRIAALYADNPSIADAEKRESNTCKQRWRKINDQVSKFCKAYAAAESRHKSGMNDLDVLKLAHQIYYNDYKAKFTLEYAWHVLKNDQKWCSLFGTKGKSKCEVVSVQSASSQTVNNVEDDTMVRPPGFEVSKRKRSETKTSAVEEQPKKLENFQQTIREIKQKDLALKDQILDKKLLANLLAKTEPLSDIETALKNKLIVDMLSKS